MEVRKRNIGTIVSILLGLLSIVLAICLYFVQKKESGLSFTYNKETSMIFNKQNAHGLKLYEKDSILINKNVYLLQGSVWNSGDYSINKNDVRKPIEIELKGIERILESKITKQYDNEVSNFILTTVGSKKINIDWDFFDPNYGFNFQILYIGDNFEELNIVGKILNIDVIEKVNTPDNKAKVGLYQKFILSSSVVSFIILILLLTFIRRNRMKNNKIKKIYTYMISSSSLIFVVVMTTITIILAALLFILMYYIFIPSFPTELI